VVFGFSDGVVCPGSVFFRFCGGVGLAVSLGWGLYLVVCERWVGVWGVCGLFFFPFFGTVWGVG